MRVEELTLQQSALPADTLVSEHWEFHSGPPLTEEIVEARIASGLFTGNGNKTFLIFDEGKVAVGFFRLFDLGENELDGGTPLFDIRLRSAARNRGIGRKGVEWPVRYIFTHYPNKNGIEATTRHDNIAMRRVLEQSGFVKEAHYRQCRPRHDNVKVDTIGYGILRSDWEAGTTTPVDRSS